MSPRLRTLRASVLPLAAAAVALPTSASAAIIPVDTTVALTCDANGTSNNKLTTFKASARVKVALQDVGGVLTAQNPSVQITPVAGSTPILTPTGSDPAYLQGNGSLELAVDNAAGRSSLGAQISFITDAPYTPADGRFTVEPPAIGLTPSAGPPKLPATVSFANLNLTVRLENQARTQVSGVAYVFCAVNGPGSAVAKLIDVPAPSQSNGPIVSAVVKGIVLPGLPSFVKITGLNLGGVKKVTFGGRPALFAFAPNAREIWAITPGLPSGQHDVLVTTGKGTSAAVGPKLGVGFLRW